MNTVNGWLTKQTTYTYDDGGRLTKTIYPNTMCSAYGYDSADRLTSVVNRRMAAPPTCLPSDTTVSTFTYTPDAVGNRTQMVDSAGVHDYLYDDVYRLTQASYPGGPIDNYAYDASGNRLTKNATTYNYDAADQMTAEGGTSYGYDNDGNQTGRGSDVFFYDHENRLTKINMGGVERDPCYDLTGDGSVTGADISAVGGRIGSSPGSPNWDPFYDLNGDNAITGADLGLVGGQSGADCRTSLLTYNGDGLRTARVSSRYSDMRYVWDVAAGLPVVLKEQDLHNTLDGHGTDNTYVYGLDLISVTDRVGAQSYYLYDGLGSVTGVTDASGNAVATFSYEVFGEIRSGAGVESEFRFTGEQRDSQSGRNFYYLRARYYDPATGRFLSQDPLGIGNPYAYANNNPIRFVDPSGLCIPDINCPAGLNGGRDKEGGSFVPAWLVALIAFEAADPLPGEVIIIIAGGIVLCYVGCDDALDAVGDLFGNIFFSEGDGPEVTFGHGEGHLEGTGLSQEEVEGAIEEQVKEAADQVSAGKFFKGTVVVGGQTIEYHGYRVSDDRINVGTYFIPR